MRSNFLARSLAAASFVAVAFSSVEAHADISSWVFTGGGASAIEQERRDQDVQGLMRIEAGIGTPPSHSVIFGGLFGTRTHFGQGTDMALVLRGASHGYVNGDWGLALDAGGYLRFFGVGSQGFTGSLVAGAPWGITLMATVSVGTNDAREYSGVLGLDFARLTVYRRSGESWWKNPFPAYRPEEQGY